MALTATLVWQCGAHCKADIGFMPPIPDYQNRLFSVARGGRCRRWDAYLLRDRRGQIFLDLDPLIFQKILDFHCLCKISSPDDPVCTPSRPPPPSSLGLASAQVASLLGAKDLPPPPS